MDEQSSEQAASAAARTNTPVAVTDDEHVHLEELALRPKSERDAPMAAPATVLKAPAAGATILQRFVDNAMDFLAHASNEMLGACLVGLGASTYLVLGRVGLVIMSVAGGVVLHATWEGVRGGPHDVAAKEADQKRKHESAVEVARRMLEWRERNRAQVQIEDVRIYANHALDYSSFGPKTEAALNTFTDAVIKDYVHYWYDFTIPGEMSFPASCRRTFTAFVLSLSGHLRHKRPADVFLDFLTNASSIIIVFLTELSVALNASPNSSAKEAVAAYLNMKPDSSLSYMLDQGSQNTKLADAAEEIIEAYLDPKSFNCPPVHIFLKEVFARLVLGYTIDICSKPDWINDWIVYGLEESETTKEVMEMVDAGVEGRPDTKLAAVAGQIAEREAQVQSKKENQANDAPSASTGHKRRISKAEEAMDEAMNEARRLTEMMIEEDQRRAAEEEERKRRRQSTPTIAEDSSDGATQGAPTPSSSESGREQHKEDPIALEERLTGGDDDPTTSSAPFTSFDQLMPNSQPTALADGSQTASPRPLSTSLTLHNANISIFDDSAPGERTSIKAKPATDYLVQIEPSSSIFPGWMIARKYADFETLHEVLRRISVITGVRFTEAHAELPKWKVHTKASLREELERYLSDAVRFQPLAESEGMKRFLEKDQGLNKSPGGGSKGFGWPTPDAFGKLGGDMMSVLTKAPKQVAGGGKAVFGGVAGLVGGSGKKLNTSQTNLNRTTTNTSPIAPLTNELRPSMSHKRSESFMTDPLTGSVLGSASGERDSMDSSRSTQQSLQEQGRESTAMAGNTEAESRHSASPSRPTSIPSQPASVSTASTSISTASLPVNEAPIEETMNLPPPPSEMPEDYDTPTSPKKSIESLHSAKAASRLSLAVKSEEAAPPTPPRPQPVSSHVTPKSKAPLSERETSTAVELMFAVIQQLYTLSGAWQIRKTLLAAAKTFLLRPGNPQIASIRDLLQTSLLESNLNDSGLAAHIYKLRENTLPTTEETEAWKRDYPEKTPEQREELRLKARKLLVTKGMPQALTSVMGAAASGEALGKVFDCLQVPEVSRGLVFGLMLQALRIVTH